MSRQDRFAQRPVVMKYKAFRTELLTRSRLVGLRDLPPAIGFTFNIPMPKHWSKAKKERMNGQIHQQKPDLDNLIKAVKDCFTYGRHVDDSYVGTYLFAQKVWAYEGSIILYEVQEEGKTVIERVIGFLRSLINLKP